MRAVFLVAIQRGMSSLFAFRCFPFCLCATFAVGGVTSGVDLDSCVGFCDPLSLSELSLFVWIVSLLTAMPWFGGYGGSWFNGYVGVGRAMAELRWAVGEMRIARGDGLRWWSVGFGSVEYRGIILLLQRKNSNLDLEEGRDRRRLKLSSLTVGKGGEHGADFQEPRVYLTEIADLLIMAWTILDRNSRPCLHAILSSFFFPTEKIANKICGCCCTGASIPFLSEIHVDRLYNQTQNALFSFSITAMIKFCFVSGSQIHEGNRGCRRTATATPNRDCGCSRGLQQLFDSDCDGDGPNHLIFVTRIKFTLDPGNLLVFLCRRHVDLLKQQSPVNACLSTMQLAPRPTYPVPLCQHALTL
ncbi:LOW QUALITY PROTEIN: hypothetical protein NC653_028844 [Populus alba x Populus x berolinensis]|uniref:Uncharacterized protein n=1 Tax=Populus alba x Populus x berolinensis TaxID=444605 RepID=A0AAD6M0X1_9ROSI|nr:LOW QUALITY PROTEIN: hypothetical protein NC653_028844 [Populus alba x Populus x berolinensis]